MQKMMQRLGDSSVLGGKAEALANDPDALDRLLDRMQDPEALERMQQLAANETFQARVHEMAKDPTFAEAAVEYTKAGRPAATSSQWSRLISDTKRY